jgi:hypothetical protein
MSQKEKVIGTVPGLEYVEVTYTNEKNSEQGFYDAGGNLVTIQPKQTVKFVIVRVKQSSFVPVPLTGVGEGVVKPAEESVFGTPVPVPPVGTDKKGVKNVSGPSNTAESNPVGGGKPSGN